VNRVPEIPPNFVFHTVPVVKGKRFVTVAFGVEDDLKLAATASNLCLGGLRLIKDDAVFDGEKDRGGIYTKIA
jgi:hypothetical protein